MNKVVQLQILLKHEKNHIMHFIIKYTYFYKNKNLHNAGFNLISQLLSLSLYYGLSVLKLLQKCR